MTYKETLDWMFAQLPAYQQKGKVAYNGKMDNIRAFSTFLNHPETKFKSIHVAGTNGKGSSSHMLASILQEAGYKVGLYTSPHLKDFRERIKINGKTIRKKKVVRFIEKNKAFLEEHQLSFFEMTVGMAFDFFASEKVDIAVVEVGLGGRLDSTNILNPEVALITNIGMDHLDMLGDTLGKIAKEKAGIIKEGIPVVVSEYQEEIAEVFHNVAVSKNAKVIFAEKVIHKTFKTSLLGNYQSKNVKGVLAVLTELKDCKIKKKHIKRGLKHVVKNTGLLGRWQILNKKPFVVCDTAHNKEGLTYVIEQLAQQDFNELHMVLGFVKEKDLDSILPLFPKNAHYYFCKPNIMRGLDVGILVNKAKMHALKGESYNSVDKAFKAALKTAGKKDLIFIGGSTFTVAEVV
ncbi:folylpolyglutamate synthase/dihydrofolate synthase family protein [Maribacter sp. TH_r10]|uniref:bifunctional folylpolyglutamate synthase/dihydrofolate synthase n=1 Tax=Maribacter sp. TH_r10 TaxID=3082086 RepID=UPI002953B552|nr:folylpolyglutamate synthase/dihydrofolate synthase family protein [Maribacter sp. TH_r10]MDV7140555.1 folylpolyglutamate synthase/dihydrofolate synthase family protein [Maribacter sp. TH_r10]